MYCDAHLHLVDLDQHDPGFAYRALSYDWRGAVVSHDPEEFLQSEALRVKLPFTIAGFGIHPQEPDMQHAEFLSMLCAQRKIDFIGEAGFDFFGDKPLRSRSAEAMQLQLEAFLFQVKLADYARLPLVIHIRKATDVIMANGRELRRLPSIIFHCWPGRLEEAQMILKKGINAYFSFGTPLLRDSRHAIESLKGIPVSRILSETDAPWQPPHGAEYTSINHIVDVVEKMASVLNMNQEELKHKLALNFTDAYLIEGPK